MLSRWCPQWWHSSPRRFQWQGREEMPAAWHAAPCAANVRSSATSRAWPSHQRFLCDYRACTAITYTSISTHSALCTLTTQQSECSFMSANISNKKCIDPRVSKICNAHTTCYPCRGWHRCWDHHISLQNYTCSCTTIISTFNSQAKELCSTLMYHIHVPLLVVFDSLEEILVYSTDNNSNWN